MSKVPDLRFDYAHQKGQTKKMLRSLIDFRKWGWKLAVKDWWDAGRDTATSAFTFLILPFLTVGALLFVLLLWLAYPLSVHVLTKRRIKKNRERSAALARLKEEADKAAAGLRQRANHG